MVPGQVLGGMTAQLGTVTLGVVDSAGVAWGLKTLDGWDSADVQATLTTRQQDHGAWWSPVYLGPRPITITGTITAPSPTALTTAIDQLLAACSLADTTLIVNEPQQSRRATVRRSGKPIVQRVTDTIATYSLLVTAQDPRRYETTQRSSSTALASLTGGLVLPAAMPWTMSASAVTGYITCANSGTFETRPVLTVSGPVSQPQVSALLPDGTVRTLSYTGQDLVAGDQLVIDTDAHTVTQGGASRRRWLAIAGGGWPTIPAGSSVQFSFRAAAYNASARLTVTWRSAWN